MHFPRTFLWLMIGVGCTAWISCTPVKAVAPPALPAAATPPAPVSTAPVAVPPVAAAPPAGGSVPVYVPDLTHANEPLPQGVIAWNATSQAVDVPAEEPQAHFLFAFTNISDKAFAITTVHPSCGCTTANIPALPWMIGPGVSGQIPITVNIGGRTGILFKSVFIATERGSQTLQLRINVQPAVIPKLSDADRIKGMEIAKMDRQAVFKGDCITCHAKNIQGKYSKQLYDSVCAVCHEAENRASMVPDLHNLKVATNNDFWQTWIKFGKAGSFMPAFSSSQGGPLSDMQIASLAAYLTTAMPSKVPQTPQ